MKEIIKKLLRRAGLDVKSVDSRSRFYDSLFKKYEHFTMTDPKRFTTNLQLVERLGREEGDYVECGVWKGGMSAAIAEVMGQHRMVHLFDSFEGLPQAKEIDGPAALEWQRNVTAPNYFDNCTADMTFAVEAMKMAKHTEYEIHKGFFSDTMPGFAPVNIAVLRLDGDWYDSIMTSLKYLYPMVVKNGLIILDDYPYWEGCSKAVHRYLADIGSASRIQEGPANVTYLIKADNQELNTREHV